MDFDILISNFLTAITEDPELACRMMASSYKTRTPRTSKGPITSAELEKIVDLYNSGHSWHYISKTLDRSMYAMLFAAITRVPGFEDRDNIIKEITPEQREQIIQLRQKDKSVTSISNALGISIISARYEVWKLEKEGGRKSKKEQDATELLNSRLAYVLDNKTISTSYSVIAKELGLGATRVSIIVREVEASSVEVPEAYELIELLRAHSWTEISEKTGILLQHAYPAVRNVLSRDLTEKYKEANNIEEGERIADIHLLLKCQYGYSEIAKIMNMKMPKVRSLQKFCK